LPDLTVKGRYVGKFTPAAPGEYRLSYKAQDQKEPIEARLRVSQASEELRFPNVDRSGLELLASSTGGLMVELDRLSSIGERLQGEPRSTDLHREASLWDNWMTLALLIFLYTLDVGLRRLMGLS
jgi:hypothetical protein